MADKKQNAVAEQKTAEIVQFDPSMFESDAGVGLENMGQEDLALPFLKILSGMSKASSGSISLSLTFLIPSVIVFT